MNVINSFSYSGVLSSYVDIIKDNKNPKISEILKTSITSFLPVFWASMIQLILSGIFIAGLWFLIPVLYSVNWLFSIFITIILIIIGVIVLIFSLLIIPTVFISTIDKRPIRTIFKIYKNNVKSILYFTIASVLFLLIPLQPLNFLVWLSATPAYTIMLYFDTLKASTIIQNQSQE